MSTARRDVMGVIKHVGEKIPNILTRWTFRQGITFVNYVTLQDRFDVEDVHIWV